MAQPRPDTSKATGAAVHRGPMADDHFTQIHNLVLRGKTAIPTQYVGIWGFITSHTEGWKLTEASIARELGVGTKFVKSALAAIQQAGCLIRTRERRSDGTLGAAAWFVTDLPMQLQQVGITDSETVSAKVAEAFAEWNNLVVQDRFPSAAPKSPQGTLDVTCENEHHEGSEDPPQDRFPSAAPKSPHPTLDDPTLDEESTKKTKTKNTKTKNTNQPTTAPAADTTPPDPPPAASNADGWMEDGSAETEKTEAADTSAGAVLVARLERRHNAALDAHRDDHVATVEAALAVLPASQVDQALSNGLDRANSPSGALVKRIRALPGKVAERQAQHTNRAEREQRVDAAAERNQQQPTGQSNQKQETPGQLLKTLSGDGAFVPSRFRNTAGDAA